MNPLDGVDEGIGRLGTGSCLLDPQTLMNPLDGVDEGIGRLGRLLLQRKENVAANMLLQVESLSEGGVSRLSLPSDLSFSLFVHF
jgi:hypothetical protein